MLHQFARQHERAGMDQDRLVNVVSFVLLLLSLLVGTMSSTHIVGVCPSDRRTTCERGGCLGLEP